MADENPDAVPAATAVIFRERDGSVPQLLMVERAAAMRFAGGALVFPGGRVDPGDHVLAGAIPDAPQDAAARIAAIRETIEEAGVALGIKAPVDMPALRQALEDGAPLGELVDPSALDLDALVPFARWLPHLGVGHRVFDTRFYLARLPDGAPDPVADGGESVRLFWATADEVLALADAGRAHLIFPTRRNLERLAQYASFDEAAADASTYPIRAITPWFEDRDGEPHLCIPTDLGYPVTSQPRASALRG